MHADPPYFVCQPGTYPIGSGPYPGNGGTYPGNGGTYPGNGNQGGSGKALVTITETAWSSKWIVRLSVLNVSVRLFCSTAFFFFFLITFRYYYTFADTSTLS